MPLPPLMPLLVLGLNAAFLALDADPVLVLDPVAAFLALDPMLGLDTAFLALDPVPAFLALDSVPSLSGSLPFLGEFTNHLFLGLFVAWALGPFYYWLCDDYCDILLRHLGICVLIISIILY
jgi:hypothetical protein